MKTRWLKPSAKTCPGERRRRVGRYPGGEGQLRAARQGVFWVDETRLREFNLVPEVICATRHCGSMVGEGAPLASARAIPLYLARGNFLLARGALAEGPLFSVLRMRRGASGYSSPGRSVSGLLKTVRAGITPKRALG